MNRAIVSILSASVALGACVSALPGSELTGNGGGPQATTGSAGASGIGGASSVAGAPGRGGMPGIGGKAGTGGAPAACNPKPCSANPSPDCMAPAAPLPNGSLVSSFETACPMLDPIDGRDGGWFVYATAASTVSPPPTDSSTPFRVSCGGAAGSCFSACITGVLSSDGSVWPSVGLGFAPRANSAVYDASAYRGIGFMYRAVFAPPAALQFKVPLPADSAVGDGPGTCVSSCYDAYSKALGQSSDWQYQEVLFSDLRQMGFGPQEPWDPTMIMTFQWQVTATGSALVPGSPFTVCVDNVVLLP